MTPSDTPSTEARRDKYYCPHCSHDLTVEAQPVEQLVEAVRGANTSGQWSKALDLIRTDLVEPLESQRDRAEQRVEQLVEAMNEARRCLSLIGHVPRSRNTWAARCQAANDVLADALSSSSPTEDAK